ncbi:MAG: ketoacyl-ACP synthase III [Bacteroidales bacterium]
MKTIISNLNIASIASYLPNEVLELNTLSSLYGEKEVKRIISATGVERVYIANENETSSDMCFHAAENLIEEGNICRNSIDGLVFVSQTPDYILPATSIILQDRLGLKQDTVCIDIHYGCSGYIYGVLQAALWINSGLCKTVLVLAGDTTSRMINNQDKSLRMVFGDSGTATLITQGVDNIGFNIMSDGSGYDKLIIPAGGFRKPQSNQTSQIKYDVDGNGRTENDLFMDGAAIFNFAISNVHNNINELIEFMSWDKQDVNKYILHQANNFMVDYVRKKLKVEKELVPIDVKDFGNTGPSTIPLLLSHLYYKEKPNLEKTILSGFGVGLSWGSIACNLNKTNFYKPISCIK